MRLQDYTPNPDSPIMGFLIGAAICSIITLFSMCSCKTNKESIESDSLSVSHISNIQYSSLNSQFSTLNSQLLTHNSSNTSWRQKVTFFNFSAPDSLGNQYITSMSTEENDVSSSSQDSTTLSQHSTNSNNNETQYSQIDTIYIDKVKTKKVTVTQTKNVIPWYYYLALYSTLVLLIIAMLYIIYIKYRKQVKHISAIEQSTEE